MRHRQTASLQKHGVLNPEISINVGILLKKLAFTLAEVLIVLGIIGIVAEMTIPTLMNNVQDQVYKTQLKKVYSVLSSATIQVKYENGGSMIGIWPDNASIHFSGDNIFGNLYSKYIRTSKVCNTDPTNGTCWHQDYKWYDESHSSLTNCSGCSAFYEVDGSWVEAAGNQYYSCEGNIANGPSNVCIGLWVDVNGEKKPNQVGKDIHQLFITQNGVDYMHTGTTFDMMTK